MSLFADSGRKSGLMAISATEAAMEIQHFLSKVIQPIMARRPTCFFPSMVSAYRDLRNLADFDSELKTRPYDRALAQQIGSLPFPLDPESARKANAQLQDIIQRQDARATLLKAAYEFANIFVDATLKEVCGSPGLTLRNYLKKYLRSSAPPLPLTHASTVRVYSVVIYRHKIISHPDKHRLCGWQGEGFGGFRLTPSSPKSLAPAEVMEINGLQVKYGGSIPGLGAAPGPVEALEVLFYHVPLNAAATVNAAEPDRERVDDLVEIHGCRSLTFSEIVDALDGFVLELAR